MTFVIDFFSLAFVIEIIQRASELLWTFCLDATFDAWSGFSENLFEGVVFDADDDEADRIYDNIDKRMDSRRKRQRPAWE